MPAARQRLLMVAATVTTALVALAAPVDSQRVGGGVASGDTGSCSPQATCGECVLVPHCVWCAAKETKNSKCVHEYQRRRSDWCDGLAIDFQTKRNFIYEGTDESQILPQRAQYSLRVREELKINITYRKVEDYPVDLYYLMDLSASMKDDKENLATLGDELAAAMKKVTKNFRLGFGSFVDKVAMPFVNTHPEKLKNPCDDGDCDPPYSFRNHMALTTDTKMFAREVAKTKVSGNVDFPEGGFDALMQAMVCTNEIKWRPKARHLLVMATDANFHIAGDGKLAGIVEPNDEKCHMKNHEYTHGLIHDYPSISQLERQALNHSITLIFAVVKDQEKTYRSLVESIRGSDMGTLNENSSNVISLVLDVYAKLKETVQISDDSTDKGISVTYRTNCNQGLLMKKSICQNVRATENVTFEISIKVPSCPPNVGAIWNETITFTPNGINDKALINLQIHCGCSCEQEGKPGFQRNSSSCSSHGDLKCGSCHCYDAYTGHICECDKNQVTGKESKHGCISNNVTGTICNDRGSCVCNVCKCMKRQNPEEEVSGSFCECDNFSCVRSEGKVCSGPEKGLCKCGQCFCNAGWSGDDCSCPEAMGVCQAPGDNQMCSGAGTCDCGKCICNKGFTGQFCEDCMDCVGGRCKVLGKCVEFFVHKTGNDDEEFCQQQNITIYDTVKEKIKQKELEVGWLLCKQPDNAGCSFVFAYFIKEGQILIIAEEEKECPVPVDLLGIVFGVIGGTVLIGLISILIWKLLTSIHDKREFAKFENERALSKWGTDNNPIYKQATSTFSNPTFSSGS